MVKIKHSAAFVIIILMILLAILIYAVEFHSVFYEIDQYYNQIIVRDRNIFNLNLPTYLVAAALLIVVLTILIAIITKNNVAQKNLKEELIKNSREFTNQRNLLMLILDSVPDIIIYKDSEFKIVIANKAAFDFFGVDRDTTDIIGRTESDVFGLSKEVEESFIATDKKAIATKKNIKVEEEVVNISGDIINFETHKVPLITNDMPQGIVIVARDITARKILEQSLRDTNIAKSKFLATMSHEMRTPLSAIIGFSDLALEDINKPDLKRYLNNIKYNSTELLQIINDVLDVSKMDARRLKLEYAPFLLKNLIEKCDATISASVIKKGLSFIHKIHPLLEDVLLIGDSVRLIQIFSNLLSNAVKFTEFGTIQLIADVLDKRPGYLDVEFSVIDTGVGMNKKQLERIFAAFMQGDESITRRYGGTGLGLTICKELLALMGSELKAESDLFRGTRFTFVIEFETISNTSDKIELIDANANSNAVIQKPLFDARVLLGEDSEMNQLVITEQLRRVGITTVIAENGKRAVEAVKDNIEEGQKPFDLILMDVNMPVLDGLKASRAIKDMGYQTPIIAVTANTMVTSYKQYKLSGIDYKLDKPFSTVDLWKTLLMFLEPIKNGASANSCDLDLTKEEIFLNSLRVEFVKTNANKMQELKDARLKGDIETAHRIAHTLKTNALQLNKKSLANIADKIELSLKNFTDNIDNNEIDILETELGLVLEEFKLVNIVSKKERSKDITNLPIQEIEEILHKLKNMLLLGEIESVSIVDPIRNIEKFDTLISQIDDFNFEEAYKILEQNFDKGNTD